MMGNRKQPFGYKMALGEIVIQESEAKLVQEIFLRYIAGESLNELTESLRQQDSLLICFKDGTEITQAMQRRQTA